MFQKLIDYSIGHKLVVGVLTLALVAWGAWSLANLPFDSTPVKNEVAACTNVVNEFSISITSGLVDPETTIPEFVKKLEASGIDKIIAEKQSQLNEWLANK